MGSKPSARTTRRKNKLMKKNKRRGYYSSDDDGEFEKSKIEVENKSSSTTTTSAASSSSLDFDVCIIRAGPPGLAVLSALHHPSGLLTEAQHVKWLKKTGGKENNKGR